MKMMLSLFGMAALLAGTSQAAQQPAPETLNSSCRQAQLHGRAVVRGVWGTGTYTNPGCSTPRKLRVGMVLPEGAMVETSKRSVIHLFIPGDHLVARLTPKTKVKLAQLCPYTLDESVSRPKTVLEVAKGRVLSGGHRHANGSTYEIRTLGTRRLPG